MLYSDLPYLEILPPGPTGGAIVAESNTDGGRKPRGLSRRGALGLVGGGLAVLGLRTLGVLGGGTPAFAGSPNDSTCGTTGLEWTQHCAANYPRTTTCDNGCARDIASSSTFFCDSPSTFGSRHRSCGEVNCRNDKSYEFYIRTNQCYSSSADGWLWQGVDDGSACDCRPTSDGTGTRPHWSCSDGWARSRPLDDSDPNTWSAWTPTICMTMKCGAG